MADLCALVHASHARNDLTLDEIDGILRSAQRHSDCVAVTGPLFYDRGRVMQ
jgi:hypothetical protein